MFLLSNLAKKMDFLPRKNENINVSSSKGIRWIHKCFLFNILFGTIILFNELVACAKWVSNGRNLRAEYYIISRIITNVSQKQYYST